MLHAIYAFLKNVSINTMLLMTDVISIFMHAHINNNTVNSTFYECILTSSNPTELNNCSNCEENKSAICCELIWPSLRSGRKKKT